MPVGDSGKAALDSFGRFAYMDEAFADLLGASVAFLDGRALEEAVHFVRVGRGQPPLGAPWLIEARPRAQKHRWLRLEGVPSETRGAHVELLARDITFERQGEIFRSASVKLSELLADGLRSDPEVRIAEALSEILPFDRFRLVRLEMATNEASVVLGSGVSPTGGVGFGPWGWAFPAPPLGQARPWAQTLLGGMGEGARPVVIRDLTALVNPPLEASDLVAEGYRSVLGVPLRLSRQTVGAIVLERTWVGNFATAEIQMLGDLAPLFSAALDRIRLERSAVDSASVYATVFETAGEGILLSDVETGRIEAVNTHYLELSGFTRRRLLEGLSIRDLDPATPIEPPERARMIRENPGPVLTHHVKRNGKRLPVEVTRRMFTWRGRTTELTAVRDVRQRLKAERQIRQLAAAVDAVSLGVLLTSADGTVVFANPALERMLREPARGVLGRRVDELRSVSTDAQFEGEIQIDLAESRRIPVYISRALFESTDGNPAGAVEIWTDLTEQKERDLALLQADKLASLGQTAASVAHEINNPLAFIIANLRSLAEYTTDIRQTYATLLERAPLVSTLEELRGEIQAALRAPEMGDTMEDIEQLTRESLRGAERVRSIVADLRAYARRRDIMQPCSLPQVIENTLTLAKNELRYRATVLLDIPSGIPRVIGSPGRLEQVLLNLLLNAVQAFRDEDVQRNRIRIRLACDDKWVLCDIEDNGPGIPPEVLPRIFDQFFTTKDTKRGTGLGLFISRKIVENHGGALDVSSSLGVGTLFRLKIPAEIEMPTPGPSPAATRRARVLLIDDEEMVLESLERVLSPHHDVSTAQSGQVGLLKAATEDFDVIVCELTLEDLRGDALYAELTKTRPEIGARFVIISGGAVSPEAALITQDQGVHRLVKPIPPERLLALIAQITGEMPQSDPPHEPE